MTPHQMVASIMAMNGSDRLEDERSAWAFRILLAFCSPFLISLEGDLENKENMQQKKNLRRKI